VIGKWHIFIILFSLSLGCCRPGDSNHRIDRKALVQRHTPRLSEFDPLCPFTVGNGEFAFTVDVTGLQTLPNRYERGIPLVTQSQWGWHAVPNDNNCRPEQTWEYYDTYGRRVPYASITNSDAAQYLRANPHRLHLGRIGLKNIGAEITDFQLSDIGNIEQVMDIWQGVIKSSFALKEYEIHVETCAHPSADQIAFRIESPDLARASIGIGVEFPYGSLEWGKTAYDWNSPARHKSTIIDRGENHLIFERQLDTTRYCIDLRWRGAARPIEADPHCFVLAIENERRFEFTLHFSPQKEKPGDDVGETFEKSKQHWSNFWRSGGAVQLFKSADPRALELERRIVLSQYLTAIQCSGSLPPQETGLTFNSWYGKYHLEMHWWHAAHFVLWGRPELLEKSLPWYESILPMARKKAELQGYQGVRWPKMTAPDGRDSPSGVGVFLIWQQPHPIYFAELLYRHDRTEKVLKRYQDIVFQSAAFMASYAQWDEDENRYVLGPPLIPAQEIYSPAQTRNPAFELSYWAFGLKIAQQWRERLGLGRDRTWDRVIDHLADLPENGGLYQNAETALNTFEDDFHRNDHPTLLGAYGMLPNDGIDIGKMRRTLVEVMRSWNWQRTWGWDYPLVAMTAARVNRPGLAIEALLMEVQKNTYLNNGHNYQSDRLPIYLPGNGGLLTAVAMMAAGWDGAPDVHAPGFPKDGGWCVEYEGLERLP